MLTMQLAQIPTAEVNSFIESAMEAPHYWIGGKRVGGNWTWGESEYWNSTTWTNWAPTEPNNDRGREDCITIDRDGKWNDQVWSLTKSISVKFFTQSGKVTKMSIIDFVLNVKILPAANWDNRKRN